MAVGAEEDVEDVDNVDDVEVGLAAVGRVTKVANGVVESSTLEVDEDLAVWLVVDVVAEASLGPGSGQVDPGLQGSTEQHPAKPLAHL